MRSDGFVGRIKNVLSNINEPVILMGDFNYVLNLTERKIIYFSITGMTNFRSFIISLEMIEVTLISKRYT